MEPAARPCSTEISRWRLPRKATSSPRPRGKGNDISGAGVWVGRPKQVSRVIDTVLQDGTLGPHIERERIGVVGHSNGGYTALAVAGAKPSTGAAAAHCRDHPDDINF